ncbi:MAG: glutamate--tRNA ligase [Pseudomonadota bacterium]
MTSPITTRFAPSPTGFLHIGGARTALFNWLYARRHGGRFLLRIEDTDRKRHSEDAVKAIIDGLSWLGLDWEEPVISQYERRERHREVVAALLEKGAAYRCYLTPEETDALRTEAREQKRRFVSPWRDPQSPPPDRPFVVRFRAPESDATTIEDAVQGAVSFPNDALDDLVILRSGADGAEPAPTYNLAVVADDHDMGVTHVIRGDDHLINAARQKQIYDALDWDVPTFAHIPLIHGQDGAKLSKRHGALGVEAYRDDGFLADGLMNYLLKLGWAHGDEEIIPKARALEIFDLKGVNKAPARLDLDKMASINAHYIAEMDDAAFLAAATPFLEAADVAIEGAVGARLHRAAGFIKTRCKTLKDAPDAARFVTVSRPLEITGKAAKPLKKEGAKDMLSACETALKAIDDWSEPERLETTLKAVAEARDAGFGAVGQPLRAALTGGAPSPSLGEVLYALGERESLARICDQTA